jgi:hypothetical protein
LPAHSLGHERFQQPKFHPHRFQSGSVTHTIKEPQIACPITPPVFKLFFDRSINNAQKQPSKRLNVQMRDDALTRLMLHSVMLRKNPGDLLSDLVDAHLRQFRVQANPATRAMSSDSASSDDQASESEPIAA